MTYEEINAMIESVGIEYIYYQFSEGTAVEPPFLCFYFPERVDFHADNIGYTKIERLIIELYTKEKEWKLEDSIELKLNANNIPFTRYESYIDTEQLIMNTFEGEVIIDG